ncbi:MAG: endonuclease/exonuclease/phosphatase family protein [Sulfuricellaceae bacterium]|jgi:endonuclease/exonuclease/phosphatase family metal-dependent hydrolase
MTHRILHVATYNIHKGFSHFNLRLVLHDLKEQLHIMRPDVLFLQEVQGTHSRHAKRHAHWPDKSQYEFLATEVYTDFAYGKNAVYPEGHHGNAILSRFPIVNWENEDVSAHPFEQRGMLHCEIAVPGWDQHLHCINVHLALFAQGRRKQFTAIKDRIARMVPEDAPLIIAGDFNDWRAEACHMLAGELDLKEAFGLAQGAPARSFPSALPLFRLDRIYLRGFEVKKAEVHSGEPWSKISDHAALSAVLARL